MLRIHKWKKCNRQVLEIPKNINTDIYTKEKKIILKLYCHVLCPKVITKLFLNYFLAKYWLHNPKSMVSRYILDPAVQFLTQSLANTNYSSYKVFTSPHGIFIQKNANCISSYTIFYMPKRYPKYSDQFSKFTAGSRIYLETIDLGS